MSNRPGAPANLSAYTLRGPCFIKLLLPDKVTGSIIGRGGQVLSELEQATGCMIKVSPPKAFFPTTQERMVMVSGELEAISQIIRIVLIKLQEHGADPNAMILHAAIPNTSIANVIGRGGEVVRSIQQQTGVVLRVYDRIEGIPETIMEFKGSTESILGASLECNKIIQSDVRLKELVTEFYATASGPRMAPPPPPPQSLDPSSNPELLGYPVTIEFVVPVSSVAYITGENGSYQDFIFNQTGAIVAIADGGASPDVNVSIKGPLCGVQAAHLLVIKQVTDAMLASSR
jgi:RNA-binding protein Nova